jgi:tRNA(Ile)-lysidine synthetase-like protein
MSLISLTHLLPFWKNQGFDPSDKPLVLAISGGADSMAMLRFFSDEVAPAFHAQLHIGHVQHGLRQEAEVDAEFVLRACQDLGLPCQVFRLHPDQRPRRESVEAWARRERYAALLGWCQSLQATLLTAHHRDDWIETVFLRMTRGEDWRALLGMPFMREPGIVRPFLSVPGSDLRAYLQAKQQPWCHDASNDDQRFTRNHLRHRILPRWDSEPQSVQSQRPTLDWRSRLWQMGVEMVSLQPWLDGLQPENLAWETVAKSDGTFVQYPFLAADWVDSLLAQGETTWILRQLRALVRASQGPAGLPKKTFLRGFQPIPTEIGLDEAAPQFWSLSRNWRLKKEKTRGAPAKYRVEATSSESHVPDHGNSTVKTAKPACIEPEIRIILDALPGEWLVTLAGQSYRLRITPLTRRALTGFPAAQEARVVCDATCFSSTLVLRTRQAGDRFSPLGTRSRTRKLKAFLHEKGVPASQRNSLPLVFHGDDLVWVPGYGLSEWFKVMPHTETLYEMVLECLTTKIP